MSIVKDMQIAKAASDRTNLLMNLLSKRLSSRDDCKGQQYVLKITSCESCQSVSFEPNVLVYPNTYKRNQSDKLPVLIYILNRYFKDFVIRYEDKIIIKSATFVDGNYSYTQWIFKNRRWHDLKSNKEISE